MHVSGDKNLKSEIKQDLIAHSNNMKTQRQMMLSSLLDWRY